MFQCITLEFASSNVPDLAAHRESRSIRVEMRALSISKGDRESNGLRTRTTCDALAEDVDSLHRVASQRTRVPGNYEVSVLLSQYLMNSLILISYSAVRGPPLSDSHMP
jgi:hypothetical protein